LEPEHDTLSRQRLAVVGNGRIGSAIAAALGLAAPFGRGFDGTASAADERPGLSEPRFDAVLLCVPDAEITAAAALIRPGILVGHCSGASGLELLDGHEGFSMHPLMTVTVAGAQLAGAGAAIDGTSDRALGYAKSLARELGMTPFRVAPEDRSAYHAAASIASNFLVTLEAAAERLAATAGVERQLLAPLVRASVENWAALGPEAALTGPVARGDHDTVARQRQAVRERTPELTELFDTLVQATEALAARPEQIPATLEVQPR
jgi:predicted short-subunit dehydrogenase-like oxidoreductase (DUF2520 family)